MNKEEKGETIMDIDKIKVDLPKKKLNKMIHKEFRRQYVELLKEQEQEIERLNNIIDELGETNGRLGNAVKDLQNRIKEVREYIEEHMMEVAKIKGINGEENGAIYVAIADLLDILDKEKE